MLYFIIIYCRVLLDFIMQSTYPFKNYVESKFSLSDYCLSVMSHKTLSTDLICNYPLSLRKGITGMSALDPTIFDESYRDTCAQSRKFYGS